MANLSELCASLPMEFIERAEHRTRMEQSALSRKLAWKEEKRKEHQRMVDYRAREVRRAMRSGVRSGVSLESYRNDVRRETMPATVRPETAAEMFYAGKGVRSPKKAKNKVSSERAGSIRPHIVVKRFDGSRLTCVCKSRKINVY